MFVIQIAIDRENENLACFLLNIITVEDKKCCDRTLSVTSGQTHTGSGWYYNYLPTQIANFGNWLAIKQTLTHITVKAEREAKTPPYSLFFSCRSRRQLDRDQLLFVRLPLLVCMLALS